MSTTNKSPMNWIKTHLPLLTFVVFVLQPLMDILSYWTAQLGMGNTLTLLLRFGVLVVVAVLGFSVSRRKKAYGIAAAVCAALLIGHCATCFYVGYQDPVGDVTNFIRVAQMPLFVFCFVSFMRANDRCYKAIENGLITNFWIISASVALAVLTGTAYTTYRSGVGILGWFSTTNAQSAIMSLLSPVVVALAFRKGNKPLFVLTTAAAFLQLYFIGTRLAFLAIAVITVGLILTMVLTKKVSWFHIAVLVAGLATCVCCIKLSPMYQNQNIYNDSMSSKQGDAAIMIQRAEDDLEDEIPEESDEEEEDPLAEWKRIQALKVIYEYYCANLCERFGTERIMEIYDYSSTISTITAVRRAKIVYCELLMEEHPFASRLFGMELSRMTWNDTVYDVENDFHGVFFLTGGVGLALMIAFLAYFIVNIIKCLVKDFKKYFTVEAAAVGMSFCLALVYAYCTAGVLRRPNSSFYLSIVLAMIYYLIKMRRYEAPEVGEGQSKA